jgi:hypothetical protein
MLLSSYIRDCNVRNPSSQCGANGQGSPSHDTDQNQYHFEVQTTVSDKLSEEASKEFTECGT